MSAREDEFLKRLRAAFKIEAAEHIQTIADGLLELEKKPAAEAQRNIVETVFRAAHSLKGAARAVDFTEVESSCQSLEEVFASWKRQDSAPSLDAFDALHRTLASISQSMSQPKASRDMQATSEEVVPNPEAVADQPTSSSEGSVRITVAALDARLVEAEEMLTAKLTTGQRVQDLRDLALGFAAWSKEWTSVEAETRALREAVGRSQRRGVDHLADTSMVRLLEFLDWNLDHFKSLENRAATLVRTAERDHHTIGKLVDDLLQDSKKLLLLPFMTIAAPFPKLVRDLCRDQGKEGNLTIRGGEVKIDKRILEEMKDPLVHMLRNSIDHGIETPSQRIRVGKPARAEITIAVSQVNSGNVEILVSDDGSGINVGKVKESAVKHGRMSIEGLDRLGDTEAQGLIFQSDISTSPIITRLSGRGLGLAIVREKAEKLGGTVSVESLPQKGATFRIVLPSMLATFRGIFIETAGQLFVLPTAQAERVAKMRSDDIRTVEGRETVSMAGRTIPLVRLADVLKLKGSAPPRDESATNPPFVVLGMGDDRIAFVVDAVLDEQEVLAKPLPKPLLRVPNVAGATVLGSGLVIPILNVADLLKSARRAARAPVRMAAEAQPTSTKSVLVAEDSITSRLLIKSILESAGYKVKTAVDGMDAFIQLRAEDFDLIVSDVEMPRLNGFDLTARIRADKKLADLPVVLVTALETRDDRERGIDVGANAYLIKSSFDQSNLLETVRRLI